MCSLSKSVIVYLLYSYTGYDVIQEIYLYRVQVYTHITYMYIYKCISPSHFSMVMEFSSYSMPLISSFFNPRSASRLS